MGLVRRAAVVVATAAACAALVSASVASCSFGTYDGNYDAAALEGSAAVPTVDASFAPITQAVPAAGATLHTPDNVFDITFAANSFGGASANVTIAQLADRTIDASLVVPVYSVTSDVPPQKAFQVDFHGSPVPSMIGGNGGKPTALVAPALRNPDGTFTQLPIFGVGNPMTQQVPNTTGGSFSATVYPFWGITKTLGAFSLVNVPSSLSGSFNDTAGSCASCCSNSGMGNPGNGTAGVYQGSCFCALVTDPQPECFLTKCADPAAAAARCTALDATRPNGLSCVPKECIDAKCCNFVMGAPGCKPDCTGVCATTTGMSQCGQAQPCCVDNRVGSPDSCQPTGGPGGGSSCSQSSSFVVRCEGPADCQTGTCCNVGSETLCMPSCPPAQKVCSTSADCTGAGSDADAGIDGGCQPNRVCPFGTCGSPPAGCQ